MYNLLPLEAKKWEIFVVVVHIDLDALHNMYNICVVDWIKLGNSYSKTNSATMWTSAFMAIWIYNYLSKFNCIHIVKIEVSSWMWWVYVEVWFEHICDWVVSFLFLGF